MLVRYKNQAQQALFLTLCLWFGLFSNSYAEESVQTYKVSAAFLELRSGPGRGYPVIHTLRRGSEATIDKRKTGWLHLTAGNQQGWIKHTYISALAMNDLPVVLSGAGSEDFTQRRWELGLSQGETKSDTNDGTPLISIYGSYHFTHNLSSELALTQVLGNFSESITAQLNITHQIGPEWMFSPFLSLGVGTIETNPKTTLGQAQTIENDAVNWGFGVKYHLKRHFFLRADYNKYLLLTQRNQLDKVETWKLGVGVFF